jgi:hypothetical protein
VGCKYGDLALQVGGASKIGTIKYGIKSHGTETREQQQITDLSSLQRGLHKIINQQLSKEKFKEKNVVTGPDGDLTPGQTGRLTVGHNVTLTLNLNVNIVVNRLDYGRLQ